MKKIASLLLVLVLAFSTVALAESVPSKTTEDLVTFEVTAENQPAGSGWFIRPVDETEVQYQNRLNIAKAELELLVAAEDVPTYFGETRDAEGAPVVLSDMVEADVLNVFEFCPIIAGGYEEAFGKVLVKMLFSTPYEKDQKVAVMIGLVTVDAQQNHSVEWTAYEGIGLGEEAGLFAGGIQTELNPEIVEAIEEGIALLAIVSK